MILSQPGLTYVNDWLAEVAAVPDRGALIADEIARANDLALFVESHVPSAGEEFTKAVRRLPPWVLDAARSNAIAALSSGRRLKLAENLPTHEDHFGVDVRGERDHVVLLVTKPRHLACGTPA